MKASQMAAEWHIPVLSLLQENVLKAVQAVKRLQI